VLNKITINRESCCLLLELARALQDDQAEYTAKAQSAAETFQALNRMEWLMAAAEDDKWKNWYRGDWLAGAWQTRKRWQDYANRLKDPLARQPAPTESSGWDGQFHIMEYEEDGTGYSSSEIRARQLGWVGSETCGARG